MLRPSFHFCFVSSLIAIGFLRTASVLADEPKTNLAPTKTASGLDVQIGSIMESAKGKTILERYFGSETVSSPQFAMAKSATIRQILPFMKGLLSDKQIQTLDQELRDAGLSNIAKVGKKYPKSYLQASKNHPQRNNGSQTRTLRMSADEKNLRIGAAVSLRDLNRMDFVAKHFNSITPENALKWPKLNPTGKIGEYEFRDADALVRAAQQHGLRIRGHALVWDTNPLGFYPAELLIKVKDSDQASTVLQEALRDHIHAVLDHFRGKIDEWDVVNEPMVGSEIGSPTNLLSKHLGPAYIELALRTAHESDPDISLFINEAIKNFESQKAENFFALIQDLLRRGVPLHGIGLQSHHVDQPKDAVRLQAYIQRFEKLGLRVELTELDIPIHHFAEAKDAYQAQGEFLYDWSRSALASESMTGITVWGIDDSQTWYDSVYPATMSLKPNCPNVFDEDLNRKPAYEGIRRAIEEASDR